MKPNFILTYDNVDLVLGPYFEECYVDIATVIQALPTKTIIPLDGNNCTNDIITSHIQSLDGSSFIFIGISHGLSNALTASKIEYINYSNAHHFNNSLFYTCACLSALDLGPELERNGCLGYLGYKEEVKVITKLSGVFLKCKNAGIKFFLQGGKSLNEAYSHMINTYDIEYNRIAKSNDFNDFFAAALLKKNGEALVCLGNKSLTLEDFN